MGDPWIPVKYYTDANGVAIVDYTIDDFKNYLERQPSVLETLRSQLDLVNEGIHKPNRNR